LFSLISTASFSKKFSTAIIRVKLHKMDLLMGGTAAAAAGAICNPLEVIKIRMQLQGELQARGHYFIHYR
jgi:hypothetical protein